MCGKVLAVLAGQVRLMPVFIGIYHLVWGEGKGFDLYSYVVTSAAWAFTKLSCRTWRAPRTLPWTWRELRHSIESGSNLHLTLSARTLFSNSPLPSYDLLGLLTLPRSTFLLLRINKKARREGGVKERPFLLDNHGWLTLLFYQVFTEHLLSDGPENTMVNKTKLLPHAKGDNNGAEVGCGDSYSRSKCWDGRRQLCRELYMLLSNCSGGWAL